MPLQVIQGLNYHDNVFMLIILSHIFSLVLYIDNSIVHLWDIGLVTFFQNIFFYILVCTQSFPYILYKIPPENSSDCQLGVLYKRRPQILTTQTHSPSLNLNARFYQK